MNAERQEFLISCMNAAVNLYGVVSFAEMLKLYNRYASDMPSPISDLLLPEEIEEILSLPESDDLDLDAPEIWFGHGTLKGTRYLVSKSGFCCNRGEVDEKCDSRGLREQLKDFVTTELAILPQEDFLVYEEPLAFEETGVTKRFVKYLRENFGYKKSEAEFAVWDVQNELRYIPSINIALLSARNTLKLELADREELDDLVDALIPLVRNTRAWNYRGHTETELVKAGVLDGFRPVDGGQFYDLYLQDIEGASEEDECDDGEREGDDWPDPEPDFWDTGKMTDDDLEKLLPPPEYPKGPVDFGFVKDPDLREQALIDYDNVRNLTVDFVRDVLMKRLTSKARSDAARRLGFPKNGDYRDPLTRTLDLVAGDFASMLDDQHGDPLVRRVLADIGKLDKYHQLGAAYYRNYRYSWLVVEAVKAGVGLKCKNLMTGENLFLMEKSASCCADIKGSLICAGIAPMGNVYLCLGTLHPVSFDPPEAVFKIVRQKLGFPLEGPLDLSVADEARFAEETIRRIYALGKFSRVCYE